MQTMAMPGGASQQAAPGRAAATGPAGAPNEFDRSAAARSKIRTAQLPAPRDITPRTEYPRPWMGGGGVSATSWTTSDRDERAAGGRRRFAGDAAAQIYAINRNTVEAGKKGTIGRTRRSRSAALIPFASQHDPNEAAVVDKLLMAGVEVSRAKTRSRRTGKTYARARS